MTLLFLLARAATAACSGAVTSADLVAALGEAETAYGNLDVDAFRAAMLRVDEELPCTTDELTPHLAAEIHRFHGLLGFLERAHDRSLTAFAAARSIEPNYRFPESLVPVGNPVLDEYDELDPDSGQTMRVGEPVAGRILFDGVEVAARPRNFPTLLQLVDENGIVTTTTYLWPGEALPTYPAREATVANTAPPVAGRALAGGMKTGPSPGLMAGAVTSAVVGGLLYGGAAVVHGRYQNAETSIDALDGLRTVNNSLVLASGASVALAVGLGTSAFLVARF